MLRDRYHVASGNFYIGKRQPLTLQAFLGSCVGVALWDPQSEVGGISHLLLPEQLSPGGQYEANKYASTGLPLFIDAMMEAGAKKEQLKACVAGGALMGPVEEMDLSLNIGGRTAEVVRSILQANHIQVASWETGGFFSCCLNLHMDDWQYEVQPAGQEKYDPEGRTILPTAEDIGLAMNELKPIPQVALKILRLVNQGDYELQDIADEVRKDQVIGARTLKLCNSAGFGPRNRIDNLDHAVFYLGPIMLIKAIIAAALEGFFDQAGQGYSLCKGGLFHHAVGTAGVAEKLAEITGRVEPALAYTAGLLHDIGKVVLDQHIAAAFPLFYRQMQKDHANLLEVERQHMGMDHQMVGQKLAAHWKFPESLQTVIAHHHHPEGAETEHDLVHLIYLANIIESKFNPSSQLFSAQSQDIAARMAFLGLHVDQLGAIVDQIPQKCLQPGSLSSDAN